MKMLTLILALVFAFPASSHTSNAATGLNPVLKFIAEFPGLKQYAIYSLITNRCDRYLEPRSREKLCHAAVEKKIQILNFDLLTGENKQAIKYNNENPHSFIIVAFKKNLFNLLNSPSTLVYLEELQQELSRFLSSETTVSINLWDFTLKHYGSKLEAAKVIAALFQDTSPVKMHLLYLEKSGARGNENFTANKEALLRVLDTIHLVSDYAGEQFQRVFYPKEIRQKLNRAIYHFYVPLYLSLELQKSGISEEFSLIAPLMMTLSYEFISSSSDYTYLYSDPSPIDFTTPNGVYKLRDIYGGYSGVLFATEKMKTLRKFQDVGEAFQSSTRKGVELLLLR